MLRRQPAGAPRAAGSKSDWINFWHYQPMRYLVGTLIFLLVLLQYKFWFGDSGYRQALRYEQRIEKLRGELADLERRNEMLQAEVNDLKNGLEAVEERARRDLGMIRKNETFFQIIGPSTE
jgi:cell division protein FtsB